MRFSRWLALWLLLSFFLPVDGYAHEQSERQYAVPFSVLSDVNGTLTLAEVVAKDRQGLFQPVAGEGFSGGYTRSVHWFKLTLTPLPVSTSLLLEIQPTQLDDVQVYVPNPSAEGFQVYQLGDQQPFNRRPIAYRGFVLPIEMSNRTMTAYVRVKTSSSLLLVLKAWEPSAFYAATQSEYALFAFFAGILLCLILLNLWQGAWRQRRLFLYYLLYLVLSLLMLAADSGFLSQYLSNHLFWIGDVLVPWLVLLMVIVVSLLYLALFSISWQKQPVYFGLAVGLIGSATIGMVATAFGYYTEVITPILGYGGLLSLLWLGRSFYLLRRSDPASQWMLIFSSMGIVGLLVTILVLLGMISSSFLLLYTYQLSVVGSVLTLQPLIAYRMKELLNAQKAMVIERNVALQFAEDERRFRQLQGRFLAMLTHELKTPLSVIRMALGLKQPDAKITMNAIRSVNDINNIIERCDCSDKIDNQQCVLTHRWFNLKELVEQLIQSAAAEAVVIDITGLVDAWVKADAYLVKVVLTNAIENAMKYRTAATDIVLTLQEHRLHDQVGYLLSIYNQVDACDDLIDHNVVFEKYYRGCTAQGITGSGLGLYIVKGLVDAMGGEVRFESQQRRVCLTVWLPKEPSPCAF